MVNSFQISKVGIAGHFYDPLSLQPLAWSLSLWSDRFHFVFYGLIYSRGSRKAWANICHPVEAPFCVYLRENADRHSTLALSLFPAGDILLWTPFDGLFAVMKIEMVLF